MGLKTVCCSSNIIAVKIRFVLNLDLIYTKRLLELIRNEGYINAHMNLAINNKKSSVVLIKKLDESNSQEFKKYFSLALKDA